MPLNPFDSATAPARVLNGTIDETLTTVTLTADAVVNNNNNFVPVLVAGFSIPVVGGGWYVVDSLIMYTATTTADFRFALNGPVGTFFGIAGWSAPVSATTNVNNIDTGMTTGSGGWVTVFGCAGVGTTMTARPGGYIAVTSTAGKTGTLTVSFNQNTAEASDTILKQGSFISVARVL